MSALNYFDIYVDGYTLLNGRFVLKERNFSLTTFGRVFLTYETVCIIFSDAGKFC